MIRLSGKVVSFVLMTLLGLLFFPGGARAQASHTYYVFQDQLGSVTTISDENGNIVEQTRYLPYGKEETSDPSLGDKVERGYTGQIRDANTSLIYYNARYYDPTLSRFISPDSVGDQVSRYAYVSGNPINYADPTGEILCRGRKCTRRRLARKTSKPVVPLEFEETDLQAQTAGSVDMALLFPAAGVEKCTGFKGCDVRNIPFTRSEKEFIRSALKPIPSDLAENLSFYKFSVNSPEFGGYKGGSTGSDDRKIYFFNLGFSDRYDEYFYKGLTVHEFYHSIIAGLGSDYFKYHRTPQKGLGNKLPDAGVGLPVDYIINYLLLEEGLARYSPSQGQYAFKHPDYISGDIYPYRKGNTEELAAEIYANMVYPGYYEKEKGTQYLPSIYPGVSRILNPFIPPKKQVGRISGSGGVDYE